MEFPAPPFISAKGGIGLHLHIETTYKNTLLINGHESARGANKWYAVRVLAYLAL